MLCKQCTPRSDAAAASDLGLYCLPMSFLLWYARIKWFNIVQLRDGFSLAVVVINRILQSQNLVSFNTNNVWKNVTQNIFGGQRISESHGQSAGDLFV